MTMAISGGFVISTQLNLLRLPVLASRLRSTANSPFGNSRAMRQKTSESVLSG
jgi:hypothetical protein